MHMRAMRITPGRQNPRSAKMLRISPPALNAICMARAGGYLFGVVKIFLSFLAS